MSFRDNFLRVILACVAFLSMLFVPFWVPLACMALLSLRFRAWEVPLVGLAMDFLWLPEVGFVHPFPIFTVLGVVLVWVCEPLRREFLF